MNYPSTTAVSGVRAGIGYAPTPELRTNQVEEQIKRLETLSGDLENVVSGFEQRLSSVATPRNKKDDPNAVPRPLLVPLAEKLYTVGDSFNRSINALRELNGAIELP